jgi:hypothetical protein
VAWSSLGKKMLRPESMPEIKRLQELKRQVLSGEALGEGGKIKKRIKIGGMYITNRMRRAVKRSLLQQEEIEDHKEERKLKRLARANQEIQTSKQTARLQDQETPPEGGGLIEEAVGGGWGKGRRSDRLFGGLLES